MRIKKRSIVVNGHKTSISLEDEFWDELRGLAAERRVPVTALVNEIDQVPGRNLCSTMHIHMSCEPSKHTQGRRKVPESRSNVQRIGRSLSERS